jgi:hypothetical protein
MTKNQKINNNKIQIQNAKVRDLITYSELLESAKFSEFWQVVNLGSNPVLDAVPGFDIAIRSFMVGVLAITYQKMEVISYFCMLLCMMV